MSNATIEQLSDSFFFSESSCKRYVNVTDHSRFWDAQERSLSEIDDSCQDKQFPTWTRFIYDNTTNAMIPNNCNESESKLPNPPCGSLYRGWIQGEHPSPEDGKCLLNIFSHLIFSTAFDPAPHGSSMVVEDGDRLPFFELMLTLIDNMHTKLANDNVKILGKLQAVFFQLSNSC